MALVVGTALRINQGGPHLRGVVLDEGVSEGADVEGKRTVVRLFEHASTVGAEPEEQLNDLAQAVAAQMKAQPVRAAVVREASFFAKRGLDAALKHRLRAEGVALHVMRASTPLVLVGDINKLQARLSMTATEFKQAGVDLQPGEWAEAATAALVACTL
ncbi:hypothetical protein [uncultured Nocardioides sp.]|uniref:hypothetical protein n=1 Tax=uncultured Nocardioides sp. TaxID=198441 RepID=UPI0026393C6C|nr:hypothetical protein [uncultured Nocardioides sp.]